MKTLGKAAASVLVAASLHLAAAAPAAANTDPAAFTVTLFRVAVSASGDCSDPVVVYAPPAPVVVDMMTGSTLAEAHIDDGRYACVLFELAPSVGFAPRSDDGACRAGQSYTVSLCDQGVVAPADAGALADGLGRPVTGLDGGVATCGEADRVVLYLSQWSIGATSTAKPFDPFQPPTAPGDGDHGVLLAGALEVAEGGSQVGTFTVGLSGSVYSDGGTCSLYPPKFGFASAAAEASAGDEGGAPPPPPAKGK